jgi:glutathione synthase
MTQHSRSIGFVMDPLESIDIEADTTFVLMLEAQERGHRVYFIDPADLGVESGRAVATVASVELRREQGHHAKLGAPDHVFLDETFDLILQRKDPPVDSDYVTATQILALCSRCLVLNRPQSILSANEKLYTLHFQELMAETTVARRIPQLLDFMEKLGGEMILKPLDGKGGEGIFHLRRDDRNLNSILEQSTGFESRWVMAQRYLPDVRRGDKRILLLDGDPIGAVLRVPPDHEVRSNLHVGGRPERAELDDADRRIIEALRPALLRDGFFFVGIDVIGGFLTEVNVTSPTGVQEINRLEGRRLEAEILDGVEARLDGKSPETRNFGT